jgi:hypothetical protein
VPHPPEKASEPIADLPNPELNPLLNPTLGRHLGRWAQVYFTTPPERRDEAIYELLHQLEAEELAGEGAEVEEPEAVGVVCSRCHHAHKRMQNFCGMCGAPLVDAARTERESAPPQEKPNLEGLLTPGLLFDPHHVSNERRAPSRSMVYAETGPGSAALQPPAGDYARRPSQSEAAVDIDWLRDRSLASDGDEPSSGGWKFVVVLSVLILIGGFAYLRLQTHRPGRAGSAGLSQGMPSEPAAVSDSAASDSAQKNVTAEAPAAAPPPQAEAKVNPAAPRMPVSSAPVEANSPTVSAAVKTGPGAGIRTASATKTQNEAPAPLAAEGDAGAADLAMAENYLSGRGGARNSSAAAQLLWRAVSKQNTAAILLLSDLYAAGDGVPKNCDQARLLLDAALRKNAPGAANRLQNLQATCR